MPEGNVGNLGAFQNGKQEKREGHGGTGLGGDVLPFLPVKRRGAEEIHLRGRVRLLTWARGLEKKEVFDRGSQIVSEKERGRPRSSIVF